jgi:hypothetical protein
MMQTQGGSFWDALGGATPTGVIGAGIGLVDGLIYTPQEMERDKNFALDAQARLEEAKAKQAQAAASASSASRLGLFALAAVALAAGGYVVASALRGES